MTSSPDPAATSKKKRVLIIDDDQDFAESLQMSLVRGSDYEVAFECCSGRARSTAREFQPDLILLDVMLNKISGSDLYFLFQRDATLKDTPVIVLSGLVEQASAGGKEVAFGLGMLRRLPAMPKPFHLNDLLAAIDREIAKADAQTRADRPTATAEEPAVAVA